MRTARIPLLAALAAAALLPALAADRMLCGPRLRLVAESRFRSQGRSRLVKVGQSPAAIIVPAGGTVRLTMHLKSAGAEQWRKTGVRSRWTADWNEGPSGPGGQTVRFTAPKQPGTYLVRHTAWVDYEALAAWQRPWRRRRPQADSTLFVIVPVPGRELKEGSIRGYAIGEYPPGSRPPTEFVEINRESAQAFVSEHFRLGVFGQNGERFPKYAPFQYPLVKKLEAVDRALQDRGYPSGSLKVYGVFRSPLYNVQVHGASRSQHMWGRAADAIVDGRPRDGRMDDLNGDGKRGIGDPIALGRIVRRLEREGRVTAGGMGVYELKRRGGGLRANVHIDVRGHPTKWGRHYPEPGNMTKWRRVRWDG